MRLDPEKERKLAGSLTAEDTALIPFLPYLLQDLWELGTSPRIVSTLVRRHIPEPSGKRFLDLACGKGAVSVTLAKDFKAQVTGIDILPDFISFAEQKAAQAGVASFCRFRTGDITKEVMTERAYDCVILGAAGDVLGTPEETVRLLGSTLRPGGRIIIDDAFLQDSDAEITYKNYTYLTRRQWQDVFDRCGVRCVEAVTEWEPTQAETNGSDMQNIRRRARELISRHPNCEALLASYVASQENEYRDLEEALTGVVWLLQS